MGMAAETRICLGQEEHRISATSGIALTVQDCYPTTFGDAFSLVNAEDQSIRPFGDEAGACLFKKYTGYNVNDEIWLNTCDASNANANKAGKYQWSYDAITGLIRSEGAMSKDPSNPLCLRLNSNLRFYKQRVKLAA